MEAMSTIVNPKTLLFDDLTAPEAEDLQTLAEAIVLDGTTPPRDNPFLLQWFHVHPADDHTWLLLVATVFPQRALLSCLRFWESRS